MTRPKVEMVNAVTREHGEMFADEWIERSWATGAITEACSETKIIGWPYDPDGGGDDLSVSLQNEIVQRVADQLRSSVVETFVRLANAVIERERTRVEESLIPPRIEMVETITPEHGLIFAEQIYRETADSEIFDIALSATHTKTAIMTWPDDDEAAQDHYDELADEIRDRIHEETKQLIADAFVRVVGDVIARERQRR